MRSAVVLLASLLAACGTLAGESPAGRQPSAAAAATHAPPTPITVDAALGRTPDEGSVLLRLSVARAHPLGLRLEPFILAWPGWGSTLSSLTSHPVADLDWVDVVGPKDPALQRLAARTTVGDEIVDARLAARSDGTLRVAMRPQPHLVVAVPPSSAAAVEQALHGTPLLEPHADDDEGVHVDFPHPHDAVPQVPPEARRLVVRVYSRPGGAAEAFAELACDDADTATRVAGDLRARVDSLNGLMVRILTRDLLSSLAIGTEGSAVELRLPATRDQLESLATLAAGLLPQGAAR